MSREEIATKTGLTELQIKGHLRYAHKLFRDRHFEPLPLAPPGEVSSDV